MAGKINSNIIGLFNSQLLFLVKEARISIFSLDNMPAERGVSIALDNTLHNTYDGVGYKPNTESCQHKAENYYQNRLNLAGPEIIVAVK